MDKSNISTYQEIKPNNKLNRFVDSFWMHENTSEHPEKVTIFPDSYFKVILIVKEQRILSYFMTGLWTNEKEIFIAPGTTNFGCRLKILAPEFLIGQEVASILQGAKQLDISFLNANTFNLSNFKALVNQWEFELIKSISTKEISGNKIRLSQLLDKMRGDMTAQEVSNQIYWTNRQINRYLTRNLGVSLKKYLNIQKCYQSYLQIRKGEFYPDKGFFDQAHFIREIKKHTGQTPTALYKEQNDRFIQLKRISEQ